MATETATIRVSKETRDKLAAQARERGLSLAAMLTRVARAGEREALYAAERRATVRDLSRPEVAREEAEWAGTDADGVE